MGVLSDSPVPTRGCGREGQKFVDLYWRTLDDEDRARVRAWAEDPRFPTQEIYRRLAQHYDIGATTVAKGLAILEAASWES